LALDDEEDDDPDEDDDLARSRLEPPSPSAPDDVDFASDEPDASDAVPDDDEALAALRLSVL
jgi:hypothetical protein